MKTLVSALTILVCLYSSNANATSIDRLNRLISLMRQHTGVMEGPVMYQFLDEDRHLTRVTYGTDKKGTFLRLEVVESVVRETRKGASITTHATPYVVAYLDRGPDGIVDTITPQFVRKGDARRLRQWVTSTPENNQSNYDSLVRSLIDRLVEDPAI